MSPASVNTEAPMVPMFGSCERCQYQQHDSSYSAFCNGEERVIRIQRRGFGPLRLFVGQALTSSQAPPSAQNTRP